WALRVTPWALLGLVLLALTRHSQRPAGTTVACLLFVLGWAAMVTASPKKFDRYLLPIFPVANLLAALGYSAHLARWAALRPGRVAWVPGALALLLAGTQFLGNLPARPYYSATYNPLAGGAATAQRALLVGWGEGLDQAAAYLNGLPGAERLVASSHQANELKPFFRGTTTPLGSQPLAEPDYYVLYASAVRRGSTPEVTEALFGREEPAFVARANGLDYAWVYRNTLYLDDAIAVLTRYLARDDPNATAVVLNADAAMLDAYTGPLEVAVITAYPREDLVESALRPLVKRSQHIWVVRFPHMNPDVDRLTAETIEACGDLAGQWQQGELTVLLYDVQETECFAPPHRSLDARVGDQIVLTGYNLSGRRLRRDEALIVSLYWEARAPVSQNYKVFVHLVGPTGEIVAQSDALPMGGALPAPLWEVGELVRDDHVLHVPKDAMRGPYRLMVGMYHPDTLQRLPVTEDVDRSDAVLVHGLWLGHAWPRPQGP
ncbi:MAG: hypothetical protein V1772_01105, partial [Chloroflexota bacterium]